ncbi:response regulator transcription factor [Nocardioides mangrovi]|uniref:Response regulator transcription factor n=1 Tax=Nocardioides mangrovi TaxID=2874580 RepID=A0ABS7UHJ8_9ACTN|nr:response regulator transcription factor [Nocardioides mangrovi]MBZ5740309.1 response regulator transcription factor [Nocardioides mangrovi]
MPSGHTTGVETNPTYEQDGPPPVRVALSNDYEIVLLGVAEMLARYPRQVRIVDITTSTRVPHAADVVLYDTFGRVPDVDVKLKEILAENPAAKVVVYSWDDYPEDAALRAGAAGFLRKGLTAAELVAALVAIHDGGQPPPEPRADGEAVQTWPGQVHGLSQREAEMLSLVVRGLTNDEIAARAYLTVNTVKTYLGTAYRKIGVGSRSQAVAWGIRHGFESTDDTGL